MNMSWIIREGKYGAIDTDNSTYHGYYIIKFYSLPYTLQSDLSIDGQVISSRKQLCKVTYFFPISINSHYYFSQKTKSINTIVSLRTIINGNINVICYDSNNFVQKLRMGDPQHLFIISFAMKRIRMTHR